MQSQELLCQLRTVLSEAWLPGGGPHLQLRLLRGRAAVPLRGGGEAGSPESARSGAREADGGFGVPMAFFILIFCSKLRAYQLATLVSSDAIVEALHHLYDKHLVFVLRLRCIYRNALTHSC